MGNSKAPFQAIPHRDQTKPASTGWTKRHIHGEDKSQ